MTDVPLTPPGQRGTLTIADRVIDRISAYAAGSLDDVVVTRSTLDKMVGRRLPKSSTDIRGNQVRINLEVAVVWPAPLAEVVQKIQETVRSQVESQSGMTVRSIDVTVSKMARHRSAAKPEGRVR